MALPGIIALIGVDGAGKTTQARWLAEWLTAQGISAWYWQNAGGRRALGRLAHRLGRRDAVDLLGRELLMLVESSLRWLAIARALLWSRLRGRVAVMDRYTFCQYANIRAFGARCEPFVRALYSVFPSPRVVCYLAVAPDEARRRVRARGTDDEHASFLAAVERAYRGLPEARRFVVVDASGPPEAVHRLLREAVGGSVAGRDAAATYPCGDLGT